MNSFTTALITFLLSWLRSFTNAFWLLLNGKHQGGFFSFLAQHWLILFLFLCLGGFFLDSIIYLLRWRPHYVWATRLDRLKRRFGGERPAPAHSPRYASPPFQEEPFYPQTVTASLSPSPFEEPAYKDYTQVMPPLDYSYSSQEAAPIEPVFDEVSDPWPSDFHLQETKVSSPLYGDTPSILSTDPFSEPMENPGEGLSATFGTAKAEPDQYFYDSLAGFAPPLTPEALYPPADSSSEAEVIHPGLDAESFQQSFGMDSAELDKKPRKSLLKPVKGFSGTHFFPFAQSSEPAEPPSSRGPLSNLAKKARNLVVDNEENPPSIRDLQSPVNFREAFHAPVFPQNPAESGDKE